MAFRLTEGDLRDEVDAGASNESFEPSRFRLPRGGPTFSVSGCGEGGRGGEDGRFGRAETVEGRATDVDLDARGFVDEAGVLVLRRVAVDKIVADADALPLPLSLALLGAAEIRCIYCSLCHPGSRTSAAIALSIQLSSHGAPVSGSLPAHFTRY